MPQKSELFATIGLDKRFKFQPDVCNGCHDVLMMSLNPNHIAILNIWDSDYCCIIIGINKTEIINLQNIIFLYQVLKMGEENITFGNTEIEKQKTRHYKNPIF